MGEEESKRTSKRSSKRLSKRRSSKRNDFDAAGLLASGGKIAKTVFVTVCTFLLMGFMFSVVYIAHHVVAFVNQQREKKMPKKDETLLMGSLFRRISTAIVVDLNPFWTHHVESDIPLNELPKKAIYMANHTSFADPWCLAAAQREIETKYVAKAELFGWPVVGKAMVHSGDMRVEFVKDKKNNKWRTKEGSIAKLMKQASDYLDMDIGISVFPEGTISRTGSLLPFKPGFFQLAIDKNVPIIPVGMFGSQDAWPNRPNASGSIILGPAEMHVRFGTPIYPEGKSLKELMDEVYLAIQTLRNNLPNFNLPPEIAVIDPYKLPVLPLNN